MRIILFTGKGGVGKTTVAAATGLDLAARGLTIILHSVTALLKTGAEAYFRAARG